MSFVPTEKRQVPFETTNVVPPFARNPTNSDHIEIVDLKQEASQVEWVNVVRSSIS